MVLQLSASTGSTTRKVLLGGDARNAGVFSQALGVQGSTLFVGGRFTGDFSITGTDYSTLETGDNGFVVRLVESGTTTWSPTAGSWLLGKSSVFRLAVPASGNTVYARLRTQANITVSSDGYIDFNGYLSGGGQPTYYLVFKYDSVPMTVARSSPIFKVRHKGELQAPGRI
jgi:hypothetical protein